MASIVNNTPAKPLLNAQIARAFLCLLITNIKKA